MLVENGAVVASVPKLGFEMTFAERRYLPLVDESPVGGAALAAVGGRLSVACGLLDRPKSVLVILPLFVYYVVFTVLEVSQFMKLNRKASLK